MQTGTLYDYWCEKCKKHFEIIIPMEHSDSTVPCKYCKKDLKKLLSAPYFHTPPRSASDKRSFE